MKIYYEITIVLLIGYSILLYFLRKNKLKIEVNPYKFYPILVITGLGLFTLGNEKQISTILITFAIITLFFGIMPLFINGRILIIESDDIRQLYRITEKVLRENNYRKRHYKAHVLYDMQKKGKVRIRPSKDNKYIINIITGVHIMQGKQLKNSLINVYKDFDNTPYKNSVHLIEALVFLACLLFIYFT